MSVNAELAERFDRLSKMLDLTGEDRFKVIAHERVARVIEGLSVDLGTIASDAENGRKALMQIEGIGPKIADKIIEYVRTGSIRELADLEAEVPAGVVEMMTIPGLGPKTASVLWKEGGVTDLAGLRRIIDSGEILNLPRMGAKSVEKLKGALALAAEGAKRLSLGLAIPVAEYFVARLAAVKGVKEIAYAGSARRGRDTVGDLDIVAGTTDPHALMDAFKKLPLVRQVLLSGDTKTSIRAAVPVDLGRWALEGKEGDVVPSTGGPAIQIDLRAVPPANYGAALLYFTGSKQHNIRLRERALRKGLTLNEYGLYPEDKTTTEPPQVRGVKPVASKTEEDVYAALGLPWYPPEIREDSGEFELKTTPRLIEVDDVKAELHAHTTASDGAMSIEALAAHAKECGYHTIAVTDHSKSSFQAHGLSVERMLEQIEAVRKAQEKIKGITILVGSEVDILSDGRLDYDDKILKQLDIVVASPHASLSQDPETATKRLLKAIKNPYVHILGHPTGRLINRRAGLSPDIGALVAAAKENNVALEINAHWMRLDLRDIHVRAAVEAGCLIAIDCDVHAPDDFDNLRYGVMTARRGWVEPEMCINTWGAKKLHAWLRSKR